MSFADAYLDKVSLDPTIINKAPNKDLSIVVALPACNEPGILNTLSSLASCDRPLGSVELIIIINSNELANADVLEQNKLTEKEIDRFTRLHEENGFQILFSHVSGLPSKYAGAGLARKIAMDHALSRFNHINNPAGIILSLDADTSCDTNYLVQVEHQFLADPGAKACSVHFEHPIEGSDYPETVYQGIIQYELHLRYYVQGLRFAGHPHAFHTVGSAFGVRAGVYAAQGGMNRRKAGEDFYFLQKIIPLGGFYEVNSTRVIPSPRPSDRVAFGTGPVIRRFQLGETLELDTYHPAVFADLKEFLDSVQSLYSADQIALQQILENYPQAVKENIRHEFISRISEIRRNAARESSFTKRFYRWFNMFRTLKYINHAHMKHYSRLPIREAASDFLNKTVVGFKDGESLKSMLLFMRKLQRRPG